MATQGARPPTDGVPRPGWLYRLIAGLVIAFTRLMRWRLGAQFVAVILIVAFAWFKAQTG